MIDLSTLANSLLRQRWFRLALAVVLLAAVLLATQFTCSSLNERAFQAADRQATRPATAPAGDLLEGLWVGQWKSDRRAWSGRLQAAIYRQADGQYLAAFRAQALGGVNMDAQVQLTVEQSAASWSFQGQKDMGLFAGGVYTYQGTTDGRHYRSVYDSRFDSGTYEMTRVSTDPDAVLP